MFRFTRPTRLLLMYLCFSGWYHPVFAADASKDPTEAAAQISRLTQQSWAAAGVTPAPQCSDREFVRRVYLDLAGRVPRIEELETFLADGRPDKRKHLIFLLTESEDFVQHFADLFDTLLMGRTTADRYDQRVQHGWREYLENTFRANRPWNEVIREILLARPQSAMDRSASWFLYERENKHQEIAEAVAPAVFGFRIECAQCHDHPIADEIQQAHYWGLVAFFNRGKNVKTKNGPRVSESAIGGFSEFADLTGDSRPNLLTFFQAETIDEPRPDKDAKEEDKDELYLPAALEGDPRVPKFSRRQRFVDQVAASHPLVARAMANRLWAVLMGRGLVHPFDEMDSAHQPSNPELLDWLCEHFHQTDYDIRHLVRAIALSRAYQLSGTRPEGLEDPSSFAWYLERPLTAEQLARSMQLIVQGEFRNDHPLIGKLREQLVEVMADENTTTVKDALFLTNNAAVNQFIQESSHSSHFVPTLMSVESITQRIDLLFQITYGRHPTSDEEDAVTYFLRGSETPPPQRWQQVVWSMLTSAEFRFNH